MEQHLLSWPFLLLALAIYGIVFCVRKIVERSFAEHSIFREVILPILPMPVGALLTYMVGSSWLDLGCEGGASCRVMLGIVAGLLSSQAYRLARATLKNGKATNES